MVVSWFETEFGKDCADPDEDVEEEEDDDDDGNELVLVVSVSSAEFCAGLAIEVLSK